MSAFIFMDILVYSGSVLGVLFLFAIGIVLCRPNGAAQCLSLMISDERARQCVRDGSFTPDRARACGTLFLFFACMISICIARGLVRL